MRTCDRNRIATLNSISIKTRFKTRDCLYSFFFFDLYFFVGNSSYTVRTDLAADDKR